MDFENLVVFLVGNASHIFAHEAVQFIAPCLPPAAGSALGKDSS